MFFYPISLRILKNYVRLPVSSNCVTIIGANQMKSFLRSLNHQRPGRGSAAVKLSAHWLSYIINSQIYLDVFLFNKFKNIKKLCKTASIFKLRDHYRSWEDTNLYRFSHHFKLYIAYSESIIENISLIF